MGLNERRKGTGVVSTRNSCPDVLVWDTHMTSTLQTPSLRTIGRFAGTFLLLTIVTGIAATVGSSRLVSVATIAANEPTYRLGFAIYLVEMACQVAYTVLFYQIMREVSRPVAQVALAIGLVGCTVKLFSRLFYFAPLLIIGKAGNVGGFGPEQHAGLVRLSLGLNDHGAGMALPFFGVASLLTGYLAFRSGFLPRWLGVASMLGGAGWLTFLDPSLGLRAFPVVAGIALLGSLAWILWLLFVGVRTEAIPSTPGSRRQ